MKKVYIITASIGGGTSILSVHTSAEKAERKLEELSEGKVDNISLNIHVRELED